MRTTARKANEMWGRPTNINKHKICFDLQIVLLRRDFLRRKQSAEALNEANKRVCFISASRIHHVSRSAKPIWSFRFCCLTLICFDRSHERRSRKAFLWPSTRLPKLLMIFSFKRQHSTSRQHLRSRVAQIQIHSEVWRGRFACAYRIEVMIGTSAFHDELFLEEFHTSRPHGMESLITLANLQKLLLCSPSTRIFLPAKLFSLRKILAIQHSSPLDAPTPTERCTVKKAAQSVERERRKNKKEREERTRTSLLNANISSSLRLYLLSIKGLPMSSRADRTVLFISPRFRVFSPFSA